MTRLPPCARAMAFVLGTCLAACDSKSPTRPEPVPGIEPGSVTTVEVEGPDELPPGDQRQFTAFARLSDGTRHDVTREAAWSVRRAACSTCAADALSVSATGNVTALGLGEGTVSASYGRGVGERDVIAVHSGQFRLIGKVTQANAPSTPIAGARIERERYWQTPDESISGDDGEFRLYGLSGDTRLVVTKSGYSPQSRQINVTEHQSVDVLLATRGPGDGLAGVYVLTISTAGECSFLGRTIVRRYVATITRNREKVAVSLTGATFAVVPTHTDHEGSGDSFTGKVESNGVRFTLRSYPRSNPLGDGYSYPDVVEQVGDRYLVVEGGALLGALLSGRFAGNFVVLNRDPRQVYSNPIAVCALDRIQFSQ